MYIRSDELSSYQYTCHIIIIELEVVTELSLKTQTTESVICYAKPELRAIYHASMTWIGTP